MGLRDPTALSNPHWCAFTSRVTSLRSAILSTARTARQRCIADVNMRLPAGRELRVEPTTVDELRRGLFVDASVGGWVMPTRSAPFELCAVAGTTTTTTAAAPQLVPDMRSVAYLMTGEDLAEHVYRMAECMLFDKFESQRRLWQHLWRYHPDAHRVLHRHQSVCVWQPRLSRIVVWTYLNVVDPGWPSVTVGLPVASRVLTLAPRDVAAVQELLDDVVTGWPTTPLPRLAPAATPGVSTRGENAPAATTHSLGRMEAGVGSER